MAKSRDTRKEQKKKPKMTAKEKRQSKRDKDRGGNPFPAEG